MLKDTLGGVRVSKMIRARIILVLRVTRTIEKIPLTLAVVVVVRR